MRLVVWFAGRFCVDTGDGRVLVVMSEPECACYVFLALPGSTG